MDWGKILEMAIGGLVTLGTAFAGAKFAFKFNTKQQQDQLQADRIEECNRTMLGLFQQFNALVTYRKNSLERHRESPGRHLTLRPSPQFDISRRYVDPAALVFLLETEGRDIPAEVALLDEKFRSCLELINARSLVHFGEYQPRLELATKQYGFKTSVPGDLVEEFVGPRIVGILKSTTSDIYQSVDDAIHDFIEAGRKLQVRFKAIFPDAKIIGFEPLKPSSAPLVPPPAEAEQHST